MSNGMNNKQREFVLTVLKNVFTLGIPALANAISSVVNTPEARARREKRRKKREARREAKRLREISGGK